MIKVEVNMSGNLVALLPNKPTEIRTVLDEPISVRSLLTQIGINPLAVVTVVINKEIQSKDFVIVKDSEVFLIGPLAGG